MTTITATPDSEVAILSRVIQPGNGSLSATVARAWLKLEFSDSDQSRMRELIRKTQDGTLTARDQADLETYRRVGRFLDMVHSKARTSLKKLRVAK